MRELPFRGTTGIFEDSTIPSTTMIPVAEALEKVLAARSVPATESVPLYQCPGRILAEDIAADRAFPPFDRVTMDGIALWLDGPAEEGMYRIEATTYAGEPAGKLASRSGAVEVMTGAVLPEGTNTVVRYEDLAFSEHFGSRFASLKAGVVPGQNIHRKGEDRAQGSLLLKAGTRIGSPEVAILATVGRPSVQVYRNPSVCLVSTGDELVDIHETPLPHQIRRSSTYQLSAALREMGIKSDIQHLRDDADGLFRALQTYLRQHDILILTGGVSAGKKDYLPEVLERLGVARQFHQVAQRPGKPLWFGTTADGKAVFALPGNPVSTFLCFLKYVRPFLGHAPKGKPVAALSEQVIFKPDLTYFMPVATYYNEEGRHVARPLKGSGSGDFANLLECTGFLELPVGRTDFAAGEVFPYLPF